MKIIGHKKVSRLAIMTLFVPCFASAQPDSTPMDRNDSLINAFEVMCTLELPNFSHIDAKATAMRMHVVYDVTKPSSFGAPIRRKGRSSALTMGSFGLLSDALTGPKGTVDSCVVFGQIDDADAFQAAFMKTIKSAPTLQNVDATGAPVSVWRDYLGPGTTLIFRITGKGNGASAMLALTSLKPAK